MHDVLLVEDDKDIRDFAMTVLESAGFAVRACGRADEARGLLKDMKPDLSIVDIGLPDGSGLELVKSVRELDESIPVIVVTARGELKTRLECFQLGAQDYLQKPFAVQELLARVKVHLNVKKSHDDLAKRAYNLELINRARQDLMDMIVHDLKTPLTSIKGTLELIQARGLIDRDEYKTLLQHAGTAADFMLLMLNDLLDLGQSQQTGLKAHLATVDAEAVMQRLTKLFAGRCQRLGVRVSYRLMDVREVVTDQNLLFRILVNLISNAMSVSKSGDEVVVEAAKSRGMLRFCVLDRGPGVRDSDKTRIFEKYVSGRKNKLEDGGTGIGLAFCRLASSALGGKIWVEDRPGGGSVFLVETPVVKPAFAAD